MFFESGFKQILKGCFCTVLAGGGIWWCVQGLGLKSAAGLAFNYFSHQCSNIDFPVFSKKKKKIFAVLVFSFFFFPLCRIVIKCCNETLMRPVTCSQVGFMARLVAPNG